MMSRVLSAVYGCNFDLSAAVPFPCMLMKIAVESLMKRIVNIGSFVPYAIDILHLGYCFVKSAYSQDMAHLLGSPPKFLGEGEDTPSLSTPPFLCETPKQAQMADQQQSS